MPPKPSSSVYTVVMSSHLNDHICWLLILTAMKYFGANHEDQSFFQFESNINVLVSSFRLSLIHMLWVYGYYIYVYSYSHCGDRLCTSESDVYRSQILTSKVDSRTVRVKVCRGSIILDHVFTVFTSMNTQTSQTNIKICKCLVSK